MPADPATADIDREGDRAFEAELERRLELLDDPDGPDAFLTDLPWRDVAAAAVVLAVLSAVLVWWGYPG